MRAQWLFLLVAAFGYSTARAQWVSVGDVHFSSPGSANCLFADTVNDVLLHGTGKKWMINGADSIEVFGCAYWDGAMWHACQPHLQVCEGGNICQNVYGFQRFQNDLYAHGSFAISTSDSTYSDAFARLGPLDTAWRNLGCDLPSTTHLTTIVEEVTDDDLFITGYNGDLCGVGPSNVFRYDGESFTPFDLFADWVSDEDYVGYVFKFQNVWYMTGLFYDPNTATTYGFMRHNGSAWEAVPGFEEPAPIKDILIHNDTLYLCGYFYEGPGSPGNLVTMFDGQHWSNLGGGLGRTADGLITFGVAMQMTWWRNSLVVSGQFTYAGGNPVMSIAQWNGEHWCGSGSILGPNYVIADAEVWRDTLYIAGAFENIDGTEIHNVAQWTGGDFDALCSAQPILDQVRPLEQIALRTLGMGLWAFDVKEAGIVSVCDVRGQVVHHAQVSLPGVVTVDLSELGAGVYTLRYQSRDHGSISKLMFVK